MHHVHHRPSKSVTLFLLLLLIGTLLCGYLGAKKVNETGATCDVGIKSYLCWKWHHETVNEMKKILEDSNYSLDKIIHNPK